MGILRAVCSTLLKSQTSSPPAKKVYQLSQHFKVSVTDLGMSWTFRDCNRRYRPARSVVSRPAPVEGDAGRGTTWKTVDSSGKDFGGDLSCPSSRLWWQRKVTEQNPGLGRPGLAYGVAAPRWSLRRCVLVLALVPGPNTLKNTFLYSFGYFFFHLGYSF